MSSVTIDSLASAINICPSSLKSLQRDLTNRMDAIVDMLNNNSSSAKCTTIYEGAKTVIDIADMTNNDPEILEDFMNSYRESATTTEVIECISENLGNYVDIRKLSDNGSDVLQDLKKMANNYLVSKSEVFAYLQNHLPASQQEMLNPEDYTGKIPLKVLASAIGDVAWSVITTAASAIITLISPVVGIAGSLLASLIPSFSALFKGSSSIVEKDVDDNHRVLAAGYDHYQYPTTHVYSIYDDLEGSYTTKFGFITIKYISSSMQTSDRLSSLQQRFYQYLVTFYPVASAPINQISTSTWYGQLIPGGGSNPIEMWAHVFNSTPIWDNTNTYFSGFDINIDTLCNFSPASDMDHVNGYVASVYRMLFFVGSLCVPKGYTDDMQLALTCFMTSIPTTMDRGCRNRFVYTLKQNALTNKSNITSFMGIQCYDGLTVQDDFLRDDDWPAVAEFDIDNRNGVVSGNLPKTNNLTIHSYADWSAQSKSAYRPKLAGSLAYIIGSAANTDFPWVDNTLGNVKNSICLQIFSDWLPEYSITPCFLNDGSFPYPYEEWPLNPNTASVTRNNGEFSYIPRYTIASDTSKALLIAPAIVAIGAAVAATVTIATTMTVKKKLKKQARLETAKADKLSWDLAELDPKSQEYQETFAAYNKARVKGNFASALTGNSITTASATLSNLSDNSTALANLQRCIKS